MTDALEPPIAPATITDLPDAIARIASDLVDGKRAALARAITLIESKKREHRGQADLLLQALMTRTGSAHRIGITGVPGVGKSTLIDTFGANLTALGHKVAVLAVDPSSSRTGGSILGDKTRMARLAIDENAFVRPSPSSGTLGGVAAKTRESMLLCEAAGFDVILVETVGIGQSETAVADMVDFFLVLMLPGAGDELQGIKKGVLEIADMIAVNKADGDGQDRARAAAADYRGALGILAPRSPVWTPPVVTLSGLANQGLDTLWETMILHRAKTEASGDFAIRRQDQQVTWMWSMLRDRLHTAVTERPDLKDRLSALEAGVRAGEIAPSYAVAELAERLGL